MEFLVPRGLRGRWVNRAFGLHLEVLGLKSIGVDLTGILGGTHGGTYYKSPAVEAKTHFPTL